MSKDKHKALARQDALLASGGFAVNCKYAPRLSHPDIKRAIKRGLLVVRRQKQTKTFGRTYVRLTDKGMEAIGLTPEGFPISPCPKRMQSSPTLKAMRLRNLRLVGAGECSV